MHTQASELPSERPLVAIAVGAAVAGTLHLAYAILTAGWSIPLAITGGLLGPQVFTTGGASVRAFGNRRKSGLGLRLQPLAGWS